MNDTLIENYDKLIKSVASNFYNVSKEDLYQVGYIGLLKAQKNYKKTSNAKFSTYAYEYIYGEMYNFASKERTLKISADSLKLYKKIIKVREILTQKLNKVPSISDISSFLNIDENLINQLMISVEQVLSIERNDEYNLLDTISSNNDDVTNKILIQDSLKVLNKDELDIIKCRYFEDKTQMETAASLDMSQVKVSRYEQKSLQKLKKYIS